VLDTYAETKKPQRRIVCSTYPFTNLSCIRATTCTVKYRDPDLLPLIQPSRTQHKAFLLQYSPLVPSTRIPRNQKRNEPRHTNANTDSDRELLVIGFLLVARSLLDHVLFPRSDYHEWLAQVPCRAVAWVERLGVVEAENVALQGVAGGFYRRDVEVGVGEVRERGLEVPAYYGSADVWSALVSVFGAHCSDYLAGMGRKQRVVARKEQCDGKCVALTTVKSVGLTLGVGNDEALGSFAAVVEEHVCLIWLDWLC
jgi:hypothetical protein